MKNLSIFLLVLLGVFTSCTIDNTDGVSSITNYPIITLNGPDVLFLNQGDTYTDAGAVSTEGGAVIETTTSFSKGVYFGGDFGTDSPDLYFVTYSAINKDGFPGTATKTIWVKPSTGNLTSDISGLYSSDVQRGPSFSVTAQYSALNYVFIKKIGTNKYAISDAVGGYYDIGRGYGSNYATSDATITVNDLATNSFSFTPGPIAAFGITLNMSNMVVDATTKTITFTSTYGTASSGVFKIQLKQVQL
ncbi:BT_2262 family domain-containing protein [Mariniflexile jejuense]|uniref:BT_2262 family domain-containing protein n=1 Tax=Mariniflexile jejuense TaxID=1173582 RepID=A0ABW3JIX0_9FLAO